MAASTSDRKKSVFIARLAKQAELYDVMVEKMKHVAKMGAELTAAERELLSDAYWNVIKRLRDSWRQLSRILQEEKSGGNEANVKLIIEYKQKVETEITDICTEVLYIVDEHLIPSISSTETSAFYYKMKGDHYRYLAEFKTGDVKKEAADGAITAYKAAISTAVAYLPRADPLRLSLDLNVSIFNLRINGSPQRACDIAKQAVEEATPQLDKLSEEAHKESSKLLRLLEDNIKLWSSDEPGDAAGNTSS